MCSGPRAISDTAGPAVHVHVVTDTYIHVPMYAHRDRSLIQRLALMRSDRFDKK